MTDASQLLQRVASTGHREHGLAELVRPLQGTDSRFDLSKGNTYPAVALPHAMTFWTPQTSEGRFIYDYQSAKCQGIRATHQPSPWIGDYGALTLMPVVGPVAPTANARASVFDHEHEHASPHYYRVWLARYRTLMEVTPTLRCAMLRLTYPGEGTAALTIQPVSGESSIQIDMATGQIRGFTRGNEGGCPDNFACYFVLDFDTPIESCGIIHGDTIHPGVMSGQDDRLGGYVQLPRTRGGSVHVRIGTSYISLAQAQLNLDQEIHDLGFDQIRQRAGEEWDRMLSRIQVQGMPENRRRTFYTALYRSLLYPRIMHEVDSAGNCTHYSPYTGRVHAGVLYTDNGFWDTHRTLYPLLSLIAPELLGEMLNGFLNAYQEGGWLPKWASPGYRDSMCGTHADAVYADACIKGIEGFDYQLAYEAIRRNAFEPTPISGPFGRVGLRAYENLGYVPIEVAPYSVCRTLDFAYSDWCIARLASLLGYDRDAATLEQRALSYRNLWDPSTNFMRPRHDNGRWLEPFDPCRWGGPYIEGSAWQHSWTVPHDPHGLAKLAGGVDQLIRRLDQMLAAEPWFDAGDYGHEIHEMTEMALAGFGQYAHSNQPVHHVLWLYSALGRRDRTAYWTHRVMNELYHDGPGGLPGDEDNGEMSAWYVLASLGFYPLCLASGRYVFGEPAAARLIIRPPGTDSTVIEPSRATGGRPNIAAHFDGQPVAGNELTHQQLASGGLLQIHPARPLQGDPQHHAALRVSSET